MGTLWSKRTSPFLAVQNSSIGDLVPCLVGWSVTTNNQSLHNITEWPQRLVTFETFDQSDEGTWLDQQKGKDKDKDKDNDKDKDTSRTPSKSDPRDLWPLRHLITMMRTDNLTKKVQWQWQRQNWKIIQNRYVSTLLHSWSLSSNKTQGLSYSRSLSSNKSHGLTGDKALP